MLDSADQVVYTKATGRTFFCLMGLQMSELTCILMRLPSTVTLRFLIDSVLRLMTVWRIKRKIIGIELPLLLAYICTLMVDSSCNFGLRSIFWVLCSISDFFFWLKVKLFLLLLCVYVCTAWKGRPWNDLLCVKKDVEPLLYSLTLLTQAPLGVV